MIMLRLRALPPPTGPMPLLLCLQDSALWQEISDASAIVSPHASVDVSGYLHGDATACDLLGVGRARKYVEEYGVCVSMYG